MAEELGEVREVIRRRKERGSEGGGRRSGTWESERWTTPHASRRRERTSAKTLAQSIESQSNKGKTDVEMRSLKGRKEGRKEGRRTDRESDEERYPDSEQKKRLQAAASDSRMHARGALASLVSCVLCD